MNASITPHKIRASLLLAAASLLLNSPSPAVAAPTQASVSGEIEQLTLNDANDPWSGGTIVVGGQTVIIPRNVLLDLPANRMTLTQLFAEAPATCVAAVPPQSGLAKADTCNTSATGGFATIAANRTNAGNIIAGDVFIEKGREAVTGTVSYIDYANGYFRLNGAGDPDSGVMVRLNDPDGRHTVQPDTGPGCVSGSLNCSPDPRFTLDGDNYTNVYTTGYPLCIPSTVARPFVDNTGSNIGASPAAATANGTGDVLCPATNRTASGLVPNSHVFAPIQVGDNITAEGNFETINGVHFLSAHSSAVSDALETQPGQPDYLFLDEVEMDAGGFQNERYRTLIIGYATLAPVDVIIWSIHYDPVTNAPHEFPLASVVGCDLAAGAGTCGAQGLVGQGANIFKIRHDIDFLAGADPKLNPCAHLRADPRLASLNICPNGGANTGNAPAVLADQFGIVSPMPREIQARTGNSLTNPGLVTLDVNGNEATNGQYLFPFGVGLGGVAFPEFNEINLDAIATPNLFTGLPWTLDRRLSPGGCIDTNNDGVPDCEGLPADHQPLDPYPFEGLDPRTQAASHPTGSYNDPNYINGTLGNIMDRIFSFVDPDANRNNNNGNGGGTNATGNFTATVLPWPPADPAAIAIGVTPTLTLACSVTSGPGGGGTGTGAPIITPVNNQSATIDTSFSLQVLATDPDSPLAFSLTAAPVGMVIDPSTGLITWVPTADQIGTHPVTVQVTDNTAQSATTSFTVTVLGANNDPVITSLPVVSASIGLAYSYQVTATDDPGSTLAYSLTTNPAGMSINSTTGLISWTPVSGQTGSNPVTVRVTDQGGLFDEQSYNVTVGPAPETISVARAEFRTRKGELRIDGTSSMLVNHSISVFFGNNASGPSIGSMAVDPLTGAFSLRSTAITPPIGTNSVTLESSFGATVTVGLTTRN